MPPQIITSDESPQQVSCDALVVASFSSPGGAELSAAARGLDEKLDGQLAEYLKSTGYKGKVGDVAVVPTLGRLPARAIVVAGLGPRREAGPIEVLRASGVLARRLTERKTVASALHQEIQDGGGRASAAGFVLGSYRFTDYKSDPQPSKLERVLLLGAPEMTGIERGLIDADATWLARDLTNIPAADLYPETLADRAGEIADSAGLELKIFDEKDLEKGGFGGILGVGRGSDRPPRLIELRYKPEGSPTGRIALVGKGITFDTGGLSLKDAKNMETMKTDMGGGAAVLGAMSALGRLRPGVEVVGLVAAAENMPGGNAVKPGDVLRHYGGVTSEVLNTDAEGRLVLGDALAYACEQDIDAVVNVATLTGAMMVALGRKVTGFFANDERLKKEIEQAGEAVGERLWPMPLIDEYRSDLDSEIADIKNIGSRYGGAVFAALFLREFVKKGVAWAHLDIAGPARAEGDYEEVLKGGTGVATRTLLAWIEGRAR
ncbi:MAG: leucyl aminopeptidase [Actinomycetota bacterium]